MPFSDAGEFLRRELSALVRVGDLWTTVPYRTGGSRGWRTSLGLNHIHTLIMMASDTVDLCQRFWREGGLLRDRLAHHVAVVSRLHQVSRQVGEDHDSARNRVSDHLELLE